jgi:hypothetical protein
MRLALACVALSLGSTSFVSRAFADGDDAVPVTARLAVGTGGTLVQGSAGQGNLGMREPLVVASWLGLRLGSRFALEAMLRTSVDGDLTTTRQFALGAGARVDVSFTSWLALEVRAGYVALLEAGPAHGAHASFFLGVRPVRWFVVGVGLGAEAYPSVPVGHSTSLGSAPDQEPLIAVGYGLVGCGINAN